MPEYNFTKLVKTRQRGGAFIRVSKYGLSLSTEARDLLKEKSRIEILFDRDQQVIKLVAVEGEKKSTNYKASKHPYSKTVGCSIAKFMPVGIYICIDRENLLFKLG